MIDVNRLIAETFLRQASWLPLTESTNTSALELAGQNPKLPALIGAEEQLQGRGRKHRQWWSGAGALTFSLLIRPEEYGIRPRQWPLLSMATGLAVCHTLECHLPNHQFHVKWPNDVYANGRKICGVLLETIPEHPSLLVVGIGLNINNSLSSAPAELRQIATSMVDLQHEEIDRIDLLIACLNSFSAELLALAQGESLLIQRCRERCYLTGRMLTIRDVLTEMTGMCLGIDDDGALRLMTESGPQRLFAGEITRIESMP